MIGIINITNGAQMDGVFELKGVVLNNGQINRVAVKVGNGSWENATGVDRFSYTVNGGDQYGALDIVVGAFDANNNQVAEKTVNVTIIPEKPYSDIVSGEYKEPLNVILKAAAEVTTYYTVDGSDPKTNGIIYSGPVYVNQNTVIQAVNKSNNNQYSEITTLDLKINPATAPWFAIQYFEDQAMSRPVTDPAHLKAGTYYLKVVSDRRYSGGPWIDIDAPGNGNDVIYANLTPVSDCVYTYTRLINNDFAATGDTQETIKISGTDSLGNPVQNIVPTNSAAKAGYPDTQPPSTGSVVLTGGLFFTNDPTPKLALSSTGAAQMRLALSEAALANALWVDYATQYDDFDISGGGNGNKTIWVEFKDQAGNIQPQHSSTTVSYDNTTLSFDIEYFSDSSLTQSLGKDPYLKEGTYYLKITANQDLGYNPGVQIDAEGSSNDILSGLTTSVNPRIYYYTRTIVADTAAIGETREQIMIQGISPSNTDSKAAYTDTLVPGIPVVNGSTTTNLLKPTWTWNSVAGANRYRYSFSDGAPWTETVATAFNPSDNLAAGSYTLYVQAGDRAGNWSPSGSFTTMIMVSAINVKQGTTSIPNGTGSYNFGNVTLFENSAISFTIQNTGTAALNLTGAPVVQLSGVDAASFNMISEPALTIAPAGSSTFTLRFNPRRAGNQTATVSIASSDAVQNPYVFTVTGTGYVHGTLDLDTWTPGNIPAAGNTRIYSVNTTPGKTYAVTWDDSFEGSGVYTTDVKVTAYRQDLTATYFSEIDSAFHTPQAVTPQENVIYIKVAGFSTDSTGSFALKVYEVPAEPIIIVKQEATIIPNGTGSYNYGNAILYKNVTFSIRNNGGVNLNLTGTPNVQISGADASSFTVTSLPYSPIGTFGTSYFTVRFNPASPGTKTATISISNNDTDNSPYTFNVTGTGAGAIEPLILDTLITSQITAPGAEKVYSFDAVPGSVYAIGWDDSFQGSGTYTCDIKVSACRKDLSPYFSETDTGYPTPLLITAQDNVVYIKAEGFNSNSTGTFALKAWLVPPKPLIKVTQGTANIGNGTGSYNYGNISLSASSSAAFTLENAGNVSLNLTGNPRVQIGGTDASCFTVTAQPASSLAPFGKTTFTVRFAPNGPGPKNATVSIASNDTDNNPYTFAITGTGSGTITVLSPDVWNQDSIATTGEVKIYSFNATPGKTYTIAWDDSYQGSGAYTGDIKV
ncbi:MAG TPA: choice-of-anchor D domain-containing protein, partial [Bacillota bacterium]|nr:choice-of-anchor D domain-containing protein [Bacillota bacterium]